VPVLAAVSLMASRGEKTPLTMTMMGGPIDARKSPTSVNNLATNKSFEWFENNVIYRVPANFPGAGRRVYPGFLQYTGFVAMNPDRHANSHYDFFKDLIKGDDASAEAHRKFYDEYNAVLDMDADYYLETIQTVFQDFKLVNGTWDVKGVDGKVERVRPQDIKGTALMTVEGELDDISGSGQTRAAQDLCSGVPASERTHLEVEGAGHYGIFSGRRWRDMVYPQLVKFILNHAPNTASKSTSKAPNKAPALVQPKAEVKIAAKTATKTLVKVATKTVTKPVAKSATKTQTQTPVQALVKAVAKPKAPVKAVAVAKPKASVKTAWVQPSKKA
jgi:poly(3-hydroxybutyrate) depolymerase